MGVQSVIFDKNKYSVQDAYHYLKKHGLKNIKAPHITDQYIRMRLEPPIYDNYITKQAGQVGIKYIIGF